MARSISAPGTPSYYILRKVGQSVVRVLGLSHQIMVTFTTDLGIFQKKIEYVHKELKGWWLRLHAVGDRKERGPAVCTQGCASSPSFIPSLPPQSQKRWPGTMNALPDHRSSS